MNQGHGALDLVVGEIGVKVIQLWRGEHPLVHEGAAGQAREVDAGVHFGGAAHRFVRLLAINGEVNFVLTSFANDISPALKVHAFETVAGDEDLPKGRHRLECRLAEPGWIDRNVTPAEYPEPLIPDNPVDYLFSGSRLNRVLRQESDTRGIASFRWQFERHNRTKKAIWNLNQEPGAITGVRIRSHRTPVFQVADGIDAHPDDVVAAPALDIYDEADATGVVFKSGVVQAL